MGKKNNYYKKLIVFFNKTKNNLINTKTCNLVRNIRKEILIMIPKKIERVFRV